MRASVVALLCCSACASEPLEATRPDDTEAPAPASVLMQVPLRHDQRSFVALGEPRVVTEAATSVDASSWDLALQGSDVFTNGGASGSGRGAAFGPLSPPTLLSDTAPNVPFLTRDEPGGAFVDWYAYDGENHVVLSRFHTYGLRDAGRLWKLQITAYYAERDGQLVSGFYNLRYAELGAASSSSRSLTMNEIDASVASTDADAPSECVDLASGERRFLTPTQAGADLGWQLCFRRDAIRVNGGLGGQRGVEAVDFQRELTANETPAELEALNASSTLGRFQAIDYAAATDPALPWQGDGIVSAFSGRWLSSTSEPPAPLDHVWLVVGADGTSKYLVVFEAFVPASRTASGRASLRIKSVR